MRMRDIGVDAARVMYKRGEEYRRIGYRWCPYTRNSVEERVWFLGWYGNARQFVNTWGERPEG
jgi:hypothetical protein